MTEIYTLESEVAYLRSRIEILRQDISNGKAKPFHSDMLLDLEDEMQTKEQRLGQLSGQVTHPDIQEAQIETIKRDLHLIINLLDSDGANPQLLNQTLSKYVSRVLVQREQKHLFLTVQIKLDGEVVYEKTIVADLNFTIS